MGEGDEGFKFAVIALTALGTILYTIVNYIQNTAIEDDWYILFALLIPIISILIICFLLYVVINGFSREVYDSDKKETKSLVSSIIYSSAFLIPLIVLLLISSFIFLAKYPEYGYIFSIIYLSIVWGFLLNKVRQEYQDKLRKWRVSLKEVIQVCLAEIKKFMYNVLSYFHLVDKISKFSGKIIKWEQPIVFFILFIASVFILKSPPIYSPSVIYFLVFLIAILIYRPLFPREISKWNLVTIVSILISVGILLWFFSILPLQTITKGDVTIDMDSVYHKGTPIPVSIRVTGPNTDISVKLYQKDYGINLTEINNISLGPKNNPNKITSDEKKILIGNSLENGKYSVFINSANFSS